MKNAERKIKTRGRQFEGVVIGTKMNKTVVVEWSRRKFLPKFERYEKKSSRIKAHNPEAMGAQEGDVVSIAECRPLSKTKHFIVIEVKGKQKGFVEKQEKREEGRKRVEEKPTEEEDVSNQGEDK